MTARLAIALVLGMLLSVGLLPIVAAAPGVGSLAPASGGSAHALAASGHAVAAAPAVSSGAGTFFTTQSIPGAPAAQQSCFFGSCVAAADNPSLNLTSEGYLAAAYTVWSTHAPCATARGAALTEIGFVVSSNLGATWSTPSYLGNPDCSTPTVSEYPSAWEPSLTSLANGTLVLAYVEYNTTSGAVPPEIAIGGPAPEVTYDRLVVTRSYDNGTTWSTPLVLNTSANPGSSSPSFAPQRPWIVATGETVYVAWMNLTAMPTTVGTGSSAVHLVASTDGGQSFGAATTLATVGTAATSVAMNPQLAVDGSGRLYVAYTTNLTYLATVGCVSSGCLFGGWSASIEVASTTSNGSTFSYAAVPGSVVVPPPRWGPFLDPSPSIAVAPGGGQVFVAYSAGLVLPLCSIYGCYTGYGTELQVSNSSNDGASFSTARTVDPYLVAGTNYGGNLLYNPAVGVTSDGVLELTLSFDNYTVCAPGFYGQFCGPQNQIYLTSSDNGTTFSTPYYVSDNATQLVYNPNNPDGEYATMVTAGAAVLLAWTADTCGVWNGSLAYALCPFPGTGGDSAVQVSELFRGAGVALTFTETGLPAGTSWSVDVLGNHRVATAPTNLVVSGVPVGLNVTWNVTANAGYGYQFTPAFSVWNPYIVAAATTVTITYTTQVLFDLETVPFLSPYPFGTPGCGYGIGYSWNLAACPDINWNITPDPGPQWVTPGTVISLDAYPNPVLYCNSGTCYSTTILNLSFISWTGSGSSSVNTTSNATSVTVNGPVNETANFAFLGYCFYQWPVFGAAYYQCVGPNVTYAFHEVGLPASTTWGVTLSSAGQFQSNTSSTPWNVFEGTLSASLLNYSVWTIPGPSGQVYAPTSTPVSPISLPADPMVEVNFSLESASAASYSVYVNAQGLPATATWGYGIDGNSYASGSSAAPPALVSGGTHTLSASEVVGTNGTRYEPTSIDARILDAADHWSNTTSLPASVDVAGTTYVYVSYAIQYELTAAAAGCGNVSSTGGWYGSGRGVSLTATPDATCLFVGWTGSGAGAVSSGSLTISVTVAGPITELAVFAPQPPPTSSVVVTSTGLPAGVGAVVRLGNLSYVGAGSFTIPGLAAGDYEFATPYVYPNGTDGVRFLPASVSTTFPSSAGELTIAGSGWINLTYAPQFLVNVTAGSGGTVTPNGAGWYDGGFTLAMVATPAAGQQFVGWSGSGPGGSSSLLASFDLVVAGSAVEVAAFAPVPNTVATTYAITITAQGLPSGTLWSALVGGAGHASTSGSLVVSVPNGTYEVQLGIVGGAAGVRYTPMTPFTNLTVAGAGAASMANYTTQYYLTVGVSAGGTANVSSGWYDAGSVVAISATPQDATQSFVNWTGSGSGSYSGTSAAITVTMQGPVVEKAGFAPAAQPAPNAPAATGPGNGLYIGVGLLVGLAVVGVVVGMMLRRRRPPAEAPAAAETEAPYGQPPDSGGSG